MGIFQRRFTSVSIEDKISISNFLWKSKLFSLVHSPLPLGEGRGVRALGGGKLVWVLGGFAYTLRALTCWEWEVYFFNLSLYEEFPQILMYSFRIQSDHSESDRTYSQETLASVSLTIKDPLRRVFYFGRFIPSRYMRFVFRRQKYYISLFPKIKTFFSCLFPSPYGRGVRGEGSGRGELAWVLGGFSYTVWAPYFQWE